MDAENNLSEFEYLDPIEPPKSDMDFAEWSEYLQKLACSIYGISPDLIGIGPIVPINIDKFQTE